MPLFSRGRSETKEPEVTTVAKRVASINQGTGGVIPSPNALQPSRSISAERLQPSSIEKVDETAATGKAKQAQDAEKLKKVEDAIAAAAAVKKAAEEKEAHDKAADAIAKAAAEAAAEAEREAKAVEAAAAKQDEAAREAKAARAAAEAETAEAKKAKAADDARRSKMKAMSAEELT